MGAPMLAALRRVGFDATGYDIGAVGGADNGTTNDAAVFANNLNILLTVVRDVDETEQVLFSDQAFIHTAPDLNTVIVCSTVSPRYIHQLRERLPDHITLYDAPMSGAQIAAREARLSFMLGGDSTGLKRLQPLFAAMGTSFHPMGPLGSGMAAKVLNNLLAASNTVMTRLVLDWAHLQGLDEGRLLALIDKSSGQNWFAGNFNQIEFARHGYQADNTIGILKKDVLSALDAAPDNADTRLAELLIEMLTGLSEKPH